MKLLRNFLQGPDSGSLTCSGCRSARHFYSVVGAVVSLNQQFGHSYDGQICFEPQLEHSASHFALKLF